VRHGEPYHNNKGDGPRGIPTVDGDSVYALGANGDLACLATDSGTPRWHVNVLEKFGGRNIRWGLSESPLVDGNNVIVNPGGPGASIVALNKETGELVWKTDDLDDPAGYSSAIAADVDGMRQILHFTSRAAVGVSARDGKLLWRYEPVANKTADIATPIYHDQRVFYSSAYQTGCALLKLTADRSTGDANAEEVYFNRDMMNHHASCVLVDGHLYGFSNAILSCMEFDTGNVKWKDRSVGKGSLIYADGKLVCFSERGVVGLVDATPEAYREKGQFKIETGTQPTWSHPVIAAGRLYLRDQDALYCYDVRGKP
jgi:outer membrane protein assembly factor BamB